MISQPNKFLLVSALCALLFPSLLWAQTDNTQPDIEVTTEAAAPAKDEGGAGDLLITPTRIVFSGRERSAEIMLKNRGTKPTTYRISFMDIGVSDTGEYTEIENYDKSAKDFIRYSPKQVTLAGGASQKVKLLLRKPSGLADGEYRTHMKFQALPGNNFGEDVEATKVTDQVSVKLIPLVGVSIPVIVQKGTLKGDANIHASRDGNQVKITLDRMGARSLLGDIVVKQNSKILANVSASVLMPAKSRNFSIELPAGTEGKLTAEYVELQGDSAAPIASTSF